MYAGSGAGDGRQEVRGTTLGKGKDEGVRGGLRDSVGGKEDGETY